MLKLVLVFLSFSRPLSVSVVYPRYLTCIGPTFDPLWGELAAALSSDALDQRAIDLSVRLLEGFELVEERWKDWPFGAEEKGETR